MQSLKHHLLSSPFDDYAKKCHFVVDSLTKCIVDIGKDFSPTRLVSMAEKKVEHLDYSSLQPVAVKKNCQPYVILKDLYHNYPLN